MEYFSENIGQIIRGERIVIPYVVEMIPMRSARCSARTKKWDAKASAVGYRIEPSTLVHLIMDNLPCATRLLYARPGRCSTSQGTGWATAMEKNSLTTT